MFTLKTSSNYLLLKDLVWPSRFVDKVFLIDSWVLSLATSITNISITSLSETPITWAYSFFQNLQQIFLSSLHLLPPTPPHHFKSPKTYLKFHSFRKVFLLILPRVIIGTCKLFSVKQPEWTSFKNIYPSSFFSTLFNLFHWTQDKYWRINT